MKAQVRAREGIGPPACYSVQQMSGWGGFPSKAPSPSCEGPHLLTPPGHVEAKEGALCWPQGPASWGREAGVLALSTGTPGGWEGRSKGAQQGGVPGGCCGDAGAGWAGVRMRRASGGKATLVQKRPSSSWRWHSSHLASASPSERLLRIQAGSTSL